MKLYIMPTGWDRELVTKTLFKSGADKVCLISASQKKDHSYGPSDAITRKVNAEVIKELTKFTKVEVLEVDYLDMKDIFYKVTNYIRLHKEYETIVNISTGSKMVSSTLLLISFMNNIDIEYSVAKNHNPKIMKLIEDGEDYHCGFSTVIRYPSIPFSFNLSLKEKNFLKRIRQEKSLCVKDFVKEAKGNQENRLRSEFHYLSKKLERLGFVSTKTKGNTAEVRLSQLGELVFQD